MTKSEVTGSISHSLIEQKVLTGLDHKRAQLAHILLSHLSENILRLLMQTVLSDKQTDPTSIFTVSSNLRMECHPESDHGAKSCFGTVTYRYVWAEITIYLDGSVRRAILCIMICFCASMTHQRIDVLLMHHKLADRAASIT